MSCEDWEPQLGATTPACGYGSPEFTNEVQHFRLEVLRWGGLTSSFRWRNDARLPGFRPMAASIRQIAAALDRPPSTISRELNRNHGAQVGYKPTMPSSRRERGAGRATPRRGSRPAPRGVERPSPGLVARAGRRPPGHRARTQGDLLREHLPLHLCPDQHAPQTAVGGIICRAARASAAAGPSGAEVPQASSKAVFPWQIGPSRPPIAAFPAIGRPT